MGEIEIGHKKVPCAVLSDGTRLLTQEGFLLAIGRAGKAKAGTGSIAMVDGLPPFLTAENLKPFVSKELQESTQPIEFRTARGSKAFGYNAILLPMVCEVYLQAKDAGVVKSNQRHVVKVCEILMRGLAHVGIVALVDEATGYQDVRDRQALQEILDKYLRKEFAAWAKRFPDEFYQEIFRLRGWEWRGITVNRPQIVAKYTNDLVYKRLAPGILKELETRNPKNERGHRKAKHHQLLTTEIGHPALAQHLYAVIGLMRIAHTWADLMDMVDRAYPKRGDTLMLPLK